MSDKIDLQTSLIQSTQYLGVSNDPQFGRCLEYLPKKPNWFSRLIEWFRGVHPSSNLNRVIATASKIAQAVLNNPQCNDMQIVTLQLNLAFLHAKAIKHNKHWFIRLLSSFTKRVLCNMDSLGKIEEQIQKLKGIKAKSTMDSKKTQPGKAAIKDKTEIEIEQAYKILDKVKKGAALYKIVAQSVCKGNIDQALLAALIMSKDSGMNFNTIEEDQEYYNYTKTSLKRIVDKFLIKGNYNKAFRIADLLDGTVKFPFLKHCAKYALKQNNVKKALEATKMIPVEWVYYYSRTLNRIAKYYTSKDQIDKSMEIIQTIPDQGEKDDSLKKIVKVLLSKGEIDKAIAIMDMINVKEIKKNALDLIIKAIDASGDGESFKKLKFHKICGVIDKLADKESHYACMSLIPPGRLVSFYISKGDFNKAYECTKLISADQDKYAACIEVIEAMAENGEANNAWKVASLVKVESNASNLYGKLSPLKKVLDVLFNKGDIQKAKELVHKLPYLDDRIPLLKEYIAK